MESIRLNTVTNDADVQGQMGELSRKSAAWYETLQGEPHRDHLDQAQKMWTATAAELSSEVEDLVSVLKESIMPVNRYTRRRPDFSGSSLHMRSVVRFVLTNFNYKRIFQRRTAGGKHEYRVVVAIDKSSSLMGANGLLLLRGAVAFIMALQKIGLERSTSILTFGERVQLVKHEEQEMDARFMYQMLASRGFTETATMDSDALDASIALLQTSVHQRATPFIFIFSDGYGSQGTRLSESLVKAEQHGITTVAVAIGLEESGVPAAYKDWISCDQPAALSEGLRMWHSGAGPLEPLGEMGKVERMLLTEGSDKTIEQVWNEHRPFFKDLASKLDGERSMYVDAQKENASSFDIDVVFVMDCTGSMGSWIEAGKTQINTIAKNLCSKLEKEYGKTCKPRMAFVGYRDHCDGPMRLQSIDFTTDIDAVCRMVGSMAASGGGDTPEDVLGGIQQALSLKWNSSARFLVLIADAPCHGKEYHTCDDSYPAGCPLGLKPEKVLRQMRDQQINLLFTRIQSITDQMVKKFGDLYNNDTFRLKQLDLKETGTAHFDRAISEEILSKILHDFL